MNKTNVRRLALAIFTAELAQRKRGKKIGFNMVPFIGVNGDSSYPGVVYEDKTGFDCKTVACIAGTAFLLNGGSIKSRHQSEKIAEKAKKWLGLGETDANLLFAPDYRTRQQVTPQQAALVLFNLAETGQVDWNVVGYGNY